MPCAGEEAQARREELLDIVQGYERLALQCLDGGKEARARTIMHVRPPPLLRRALQARARLLAPRPRSCP